MLNDLVRVKEPDAIKLSGAMEIQLMRVEGEIQEFHLSDGIATYVIKTLWSSGLLILEPRSQAEPDKIEPCDAHTANGFESISSVR